MSTAVGPQVTFANDIAPILYRQCASCHRPDGPAPFSLLTYDDVRQRAAQIAAVTGSRYMPPWKPEAGFGDLAGERRLTDEQILAIDRWVKTGLAEGNPSDVPPPPRWSAGWQLGEPDLVVTLPEYTLRADGTDVFRNFVVTVPGTTTRYVRGFEFRPGSRTVHHANIRVDPTPASRRLEAADPAPGYEGAILHSADYPDGHFLGWTPGQATPLASNDLAWRLEAGSDLVLQLHLQPSGKPERVRPSIGLYFTSEAPARTPTIVRLGRQDLDIPAGAAAHRIGDAYVLPVDAEVRAIQPHAHYRARSVSAWATQPGGARRPLILIRNWDFNWQDQYRYATPFWVPAGTKLEMEYMFDNSDANPRNPTQPASRVGWGWRSSDEMADVWIQVMTRTEEDRARLGVDVRRKMAAEDVVGCETLIAREPDHVDLRNDAARLYLELGQPQRALTHFAVVRSLQPQSAVGALQRGGHARGARPHGGRGTRVRSRAAVRPGVFGRAQQSRQPAGGGGAGRRGARALRARGRVGTGERRSAEQPRRRPAGVRRSRRRRSPHLQEAIRLRRRVRRRRISTSRARTRRPGGSRRRSAKRRSRSSRPPRPARARWRRRSGSSCSYTVSVVEVRRPFSTLSCRHAALAPKPIRRLETAVSPTRESVPR